MDDFFDNEQKNKLSQLETELMLTNIYFYYTEHVYKGLGDSTSKAIGWLLPRKQVSYARLLDSVLSGPSMITNDENVLFSQYYKLRDVLRRYQDIEIRRAWHTTEQDSNLNNQTVFIRKMEMPIGDRIKKIIVNMERCRWISAGLDKAPVYIFVNIPSFKLNLYRNGKSELESAVIVGADLTKTVIFSGMMNQIVFNPYWYLPKSIIEEEVKPGIEKNKHYLKLHRMEWHDGQLRQLPGKNNSLGLIKFLFPNSNDIYIHDTPAKSLFAKQSRALSHGCIRVETPAALAMAVLKGDSEWTPERIEAAMNAGEESSYMLKNKIPVIIGYLTAWVDEKGDIHFFKDIYDRDDRLARLLIEDE
jgi:murein L,D-transpeptidase YcbB/YkuD